MYKFLVVEWLHLECEQTKKNKSAFDLQTSFNMWRLNTQSIFFLEFLS